MNADRRAKLKALYESLTAARSDLEKLADDEQEAFDNMPENFQNSERGERQSADLETLLGVQNDLDNAIDGLEGIDGVVVY
jgi:hypothetical protein